MNAVQTHILPGAVPLAVSVAGNGPLVILVHGMGGDRTTWRPQLAALRSTFTAVSVDLRGYGDSGLTQTPLDFHRDFGADLLAVMDYFSVERAHVVGLSMGGRVARGVALRHAQRVASLTLANTSAGFDDMDEAATRRFIEERSTELHAGLLPAGFGLQQARHMMATDASPDALRIAAEAMQRLRPRHYLAVLEASTRQDRGDRLEDIRCPTLVVTSDQDRVYPPAVTDALVRRIGHAQQARIHGAGHLSNLERPEAFNAALLTFLQALPREADARVP